MTKTVHLQRTAATVSRVKGTSPNLSECHEWNKTVASLFQNSPVMSFYFLFYVQFTWVYVMIPGTHRVCNTTANPCMCTKCKTLLPQTAFFRSGSGGTRDAANLNVIPVQHIGRLALHAKNNCPKRLFLLLLSYRIPIATSDVRVACKMS